MQYPENLKYSKDHEWAKIEGNSITVGITDHAQKALGDVVFTELPTVGRNLKKGETFGVVESIKAVSDLYAPVTGKVTAVNAELANNPAEINQDPHGTAWMIQMEVTDPESIQELMDAASYIRYVNSLK